VNEPIIKSKRKFDFLSEDLFKNFPYLPSNYQKFDMMQLNKDWDIFFVHTQSSVN